MGPGIQRKCQSGSNRGKDRLQSADGNFSGRFRVVPLGKARVHVLTEAQCVGFILKALAMRRGGWVLTLNLDILRRFQRDPICAALYEQADLVVADGKPIVWACRILGSPQAERVSGSSLICSLSAAAARSGNSIYLLGGRPGSARKAAEILKKRFSGLRVAGTSCPEMGFENTPERVGSLLKTVSEAGPDIVYVALGSPKQERLISQLRKAHPCAWYIGVGISFSLLRGDIRRAPMWMQKAGLEWIHRLAQEPQRLFGRYVIQGIPFAIILLGSAFFRRVTGNRGSGAFRSNGL